MTVMEQRTYNYTRLSLTKILSSELKIIFHSESVVPDISLLDYWVLMSWVLYLQPSFQQLKDFPFSLTLYDKRKSMKRILVLILSLFALAMLPTMAQSDNCRKKAEGYTREAEYYQKKADGYRREAEYYLKKAAGYDTDRAQTQQRWAADALRH